jgi:predicted DsbA family dithiol-disulfide isomerase
LSVTLIATKPCFLNSQDLTDDAVVANVVQPTGLSPELVAQCLVKGAAPQLAAQATDQRWRNMQVQGVPLFVFQHKWAVSRAQPPEALLEAMVQSALQARE